MQVKKMKFVLVAALAASILAPVSTSTAATTFTAAVNQATNLSRSGETLVITMSGVPEGQGVYVYQCVASSDANQRPTKCVGQQGTIWTTKDSGPGSAGSIPFTGSVNINVLHTFIAKDTTTVDCDIAACGIFVRRDHMGGSTDKSLDLFIPISFAPQYGVTVSKTTDLIPAGENLIVNLTGLVYNQGVYVRECARTLDGSRPTDCDGLGVWASLDPAQLALHATNAATPITLPVKSTFVTGVKTVDCSKSGCDVFVRRDHMGSGDTTLDRLIPLTFKVMTVPSGTVRKLKSNFVLEIKNAKGSTLQVRIGNKSSILKPTKDDFRFRVPVGKNAGKLITIKVTEGSRILVDAKIKG